MKGQQVILVDDKDGEIGTEEKMKAHQNGGRLHRAVSVFLFNSKGETMLQKRAMTKYHSKGLWANTCCSHPFPGEENGIAAERRLKEEMGIDCRLREAFEFPYTADVGEGLTEREFDHVFFGDYDGKPSINREEVSDWKWVTLGQLKDDISKSPKNFVPWLILMMDKVIESRKAASLV